MVVDAGNPSMLSEDVAPMLLVGNTNLFHILRLQYRNTIEEKIRFDGYGLNVDYVVNEPLRILNRNLQRFVFTDLVSYDSDGKLALGFQLFVIDGMVSMFEGFPMAGDEWPKGLITPKYTFWLSGYGNVESDTRFAKTIEKFNSHDPIITNEILNSVGGKPLPSWPPLVECA